MEHWNTRTYMAFWGCIILANVTDKFWTFTTLSIICLLIFSYKSYKE